MSRRNLTPEQVSYYRGLQYEREKGKREENLKQNQDRPKAKNLPSVNVAEKLAEQHKVSHQTIKNDAQFARAIATLSETCGHNVINLLLNRETKLSRQDVSRLALVAKHNVPHAIDTLDLVLTQVASYADKRSQPGH